MTKTVRVSKIKSAKTVFVGVALLLLAVGAGAQTGTLFVEGDQVGIGTSAPQADLEIFDNLDFAALRLNNTTATFAFAVNTLGQFTINKIGSGGQELSVNTRFDGDGAATMDVQGSVRGTQFISSSSREVKTDFSLLDSKEVLEHLVAMPILSWRYKTEDDSIRHFGPVAEDFQAAYGLGDGRHISNVDATGVTMAAIQGLYDTVQEKDAEIEELEARLAHLESLVASLMAQ